MKNFQLYLVICWLSNQVKQSAETAIKNNSQSSIQTTILLYSVCDSTR